MHGRLILFHVIVVALGSAALAAQAQFYDLDGKYSCLAAPDKSCPGGAVLPELPPAPPPAPPPIVWNQLLADIRAQKLSDAELKLIETGAAKKEPRAVEALAWCQLTGLGMPADPIAAYFLYGEAAGLGVPNAAANQRAIFERKLTQEQRQTVLMREQTH